MHDVSMSAASAAEAYLENVELESRPRAQEMLGAVPLPNDEARCCAISKRSSKRCKRYAQPGSSMCAKHTQASRRLRAYSAREGPGH